ncbi:MAG: hypothetical protein HUK16_10160 [Bacteroidales bacterium]|nr:hypothetical protein [Bacteroidales bacterium]
MKQKEHEKYQGKIERFVGNIHDLSDGVNLCYMSLFHVVAMEERLFLVKRDSLCPLLIDDWICQQLRKMAIRLIHGLAYQY